MLNHSDSGIGSHPRWYALAAILLALTIFPILEQSKDKDTTGKAAADEYKISVDVGMVVLPVVVTDRRGQEVSGLGQDSFQVFEDGRPQKIALFESEDVPVTVGLVIDNSGSMAHKRPDVIAAAEEFAKSSNPHDQMFVVSFNEKVVMGLPKDVPFTSEVEQIRDAITRTPASGNTALYDGLAAALDHVKTGTTNRKALIVISDGGDNASHLYFTDVLKRAEASNVEIYTLGVFDESFVDEDMNLGALKRLAKVTGGKSYTPQSPSEITGICKQIASDLRHQYTIGYQPPNSNAGVYHAVRVIASAPADGKLRVTTRSGYLMPSEPQVLPPTPSTKASL